MGGVVLSHINCIYLVSFLDSFSIGILIPLFSPFLKSVGASHLAIGLSSSLYGVAQLASGPFVGSWSDNYGHTLVLSISLVICSIGYLLVGFIQAIELILILRFIIGCFKHTQSLCKAFIADEVSPDHHANAYGTLYAISSIGFIVGPAIGGHLAEKTNDISIITVAVSACFWLNIALAHTLPQTKVKKRRAPSHKSNAFLIFTHLKNINWTPYKNIMMLKLCFVYCTALYYNNISLTLKERYAASTKTVGYIISFQALIQSFSAFMLGKVEKLYPFNGSRKSNTAKCFITLAISFTGLFQTYTIPMLLFWLVPFSICQAALRSLLLELLIENTSEQERGSLLGAFQSLSGLGKLSAPIIAGIATDQFSPLALPLITIGIAVMGSVISFE